MQADRVTITSVDNTTYPGLAIATATIGLNGTDNTGTPVYTSYAIKVVCGDDAYSVLSAVLGQAYDFSQQVVSRGTLENFTGTTSQDTVGSSFTL